MSVMIPEDVATMAGGPEPIGPPGEPPMAPPGPPPGMDPMGCAPTRHAACPAVVGFLLSLRAFSEEGRRSAPGRPARRGRRGQRGRHPLRGARRADGVPAVASDDIEKAKAMKAANIVQDLLASNQKERRPRRGSAPRRRGWLRRSAADGAPPQDGERPDARPDRREGRQADRARRARLPRPLAVGGRQAPRRVPRHRRRPRRRPRVAVADLPAAPDPDHRGDDRLDGGAEPEARCAPQAAPQGDPGGGDRCARTRRRSPRWRSTTRWSRTASA